MKLTTLVRASRVEWHIPATGPMRVPVILYGTRQVLQDMDEKVREQACNVAALPGIVKASYAMPDAHWGYGFPIGGVAAFDPGLDGVISAGGVGFDISCGVRTLHTGLTREAIAPFMERLADSLFAAIPAGMGSTGRLRLSADDMDEMLAGGARWAVEQGYGMPDDLERIEERGCAAGAAPEHVSQQARDRQRDQVGTLGSGNHYLEVQHVVQVFDDMTAFALGLHLGEVVISIHCGSRGLGHQIGTEFLSRMVVAAREYGIVLPDRELACAPIGSALGREYLGAMRAGVNCALANRQVLTHLVREVFAEAFPGEQLPLLYDVSHNTCKVEQHVVDGSPRTLYVHRKGATRAFGPGHPDLPESLREVGQPVLIGGTMGTASYVLVGTESSEEAAFASACHGAGRSMSRAQATKRWNGREVVERLKSEGIIIRSRSPRGVAEEAPEAYKDVDLVVDSTDAVGLAYKVAKLEPLICVKG